MARLLLCCVAVLGLNVPGRAGELDREPAAAGPATLTAKAPVLDAKAVAGSEMDKDSPEQAWRCGGWGWGCRPFCGFGCYRPFCGFGFGYSCYRPFCGFGFGCYPCFACYSPCYAGCFGGFCGVW
jgi:hypothetical protein